MSARKQPMIWATLAGLLIIAIPVLAAFALAARQSRLEQEQHAATLANAVLRRSEQISHQISTAQNTLMAAQGAPCSPRQLQLMARMTAENPLLIAVGHVEHDRLMCSTFGLHGAGIPLGPRTYQSGLGYDIRTAVVLPGLTENTLVFATDPRSGFTAMIHPDVPLNMVTDETDVSLGLFAAKSGSLLARHGAFRPSWVRHLTGDRTDVRFVDGEYVVAIGRSSRYDYAAYAAVPIVRLNQGWLSLVLTLVPLGMAAGLALAFVLFWLTRRHQSLSTQLKRAIRRKELFLVYQPVVELATGRWVGAEALVRWRGDDGELVPPDVFIPVAEHRGLVGLLTELVFELCVRDMQPLMRRHPDFHVAVNVGASDLAENGEVGRLARRLVEAGLSPASFMVEATERALLDTEATRRALHELHQHDMRLAIDDFGTGYSSLAYLATLDVDCLKIDRTFVETIGSDAATSGVVGHIIDMGKTLRLEMIAEGVETQAQADYLRERGVPLAQGWLFSKPLAPEDLGRALDRQTDAPSGTAAT